MQDTAKCPDCSHNCAYPLRWLIIDRSAGELSIETDTPCRPAGRIVKRCGRYTDAQREIAELRAYYAR